MKTSLDHLPERKQREIERVTRILLEQAEEATAIATGFRRRMRVYKIILFGSYARGGWVDEGPRGYQSDYDLLIVVSHEALTDVPSIGWRPRTGSSATPRSQRRSRSSSTAWTT